MAPHNALRQVEAKLRSLDTYIGKNDPVWTALDTLWDLVVKGTEETA
jgi:hypothetical protein